MKYKILSGWVVGLGGKHLKKGQEYEATSFVRGTIDLLLNRGSIEEVVEIIKPLPTPKLVPLEGKIRVAIVTAVWKRPEVFKMFAKGVYDLMEKTPIEYEVLISGSEGRKSKKMVESYGFKYFEIPNQPLAAKVNKPVLEAKNLNVDYVLCLGSDDIITPEVMMEYEKCMRKGIDYIGLLDFYFYDLVSKKAIYWGGYRESYRKGHTVGAGRLISKRLMNAWNWSPWQTEHSRGLDSSMQIKLKTTPHTKEVFSLKEKGLFALDIKSEVNMTPFKLWDNAEYIPVKKIKQKFPYVCAV